MKPESQRVPLGYGGLFLREYEGGVLVTRELLLSPRDHCSLEVCSLRMSSAEADRAVIMSTFSAAANASLCMRFCSREHFGKWRLTELPEEFGFLLSNVKLYGIGEFIGEQWAN